MSKSPSHIFAKVLANFHLALYSVAHTKAKKLTSGEQRRLTIAEDIVHGPHLIMIDEPITNLNARESSIIMTQAVRELVNQDRTVIITLHQVPHLCPVRGCKIGTNHLFDSPPLLCLSCATRWRC